MSLPQFTDLPEGFDIGKSICQILTSIAMEEVGLSHIINAEGEKLQYVLGTLNTNAQPAAPTIDQLLDVNESVMEMLQQVGFNQMFLNKKMSDALKAYYQYHTNDPQNPTDPQEPPNSPNPPGPPNPPEPPEPPGPQDPSKPGADSDLGDIPNINNGSVITIDGIEWYKVNQTSVSGKNYVLLMLKGTAGFWPYGNRYDTDLEYGNSTIKAKVDDWYVYLASPKLKSIAVEANPGTSPYASWPSPGTGIYAHLPRTETIKDLGVSARVIDGKDYWLAEPTEPYSGAGRAFQVIVEGNGPYGSRKNDTPAYARPIIWVSVP